MTADEAADTLYADITARVQYFQKEFDIPIASIIGAIEMVKHDILNGVDVDFNSDMDLGDDD
jgi:hypothetical protein